MYVPLCDDNGTYGANMTLMVTISNSNPCEFLQTMTITSCVTSLMLLRYIQQLYFMQPFNYIIIQLEYCVNFYIMPE